MFDSSGGMMGQGKTNKSIENECETESTIMGKLKEMVSEETKGANRFKYSARRLQLAGIGLFAKVVEAGGPADDETVVGKLTTLGNGTLNIVKDESQRIFEELVEAGEKFSAKDEVQPAQAAVKTVADKEEKLKPVKTEKTVSTKKPAEAIKGASQPKKAPRSKSVEINMELQKAFADARAKAEVAKDLPHEQSLALLALVLQAEEGDVKGRRPAKAKVEACEIFDARKEIKGMKQEEAMSRYVEVVQELA